MAMWQTIIQGASSLCSSIDGVKCVKEEQQGRTSFLELSLGV
jgi:hypothetical protein